MDKDSSFYIVLTIVLFALLGLSAFFSFSETSYSTLSRIKLKNMAAKNKLNGNIPSGRRSTRARLALSLLDIYDQLLSSILIGNTIVNISASALTTFLFISLYGTSSVSIGASLITLIILIFCEITPKTLAKESPELTAIRSAPLLRFFVFVFTPLNFLAGSWKKIIIRLFPVKADRSVTENELLTFVEEVRQEGGINKQEEQMIRQAIKFDDITAADIITPRIDVTAVPENYSAEELDNVFASSGFSRLPVFRGSIDTITGVILLKDFHHEVIKKGRKPSDVIIPVVFAPKTMKVSELLQTMKSKQSHLAVVVDEFGGTFGIVTIEDIVEELVGEIWDEHDEVVEPFRQNTDGSFSVLGSAKLLEMLEHIFNVDTSDDLPYDVDEIPNTTIGSWVMEIAGGPPRPKEQFNWHNLKITVLRVQRHRIMEINVKINTL